MLDFTAYEICTNCDLEFKFTVDAALTANVITPTQPITCPGCGMTYQFDAEKQEWIETGEKVRKP